MADDLEGLGGITTIFRTAPDWARAADVSFSPSAQVLGFNASVQERLSFTEDAPKTFNFLFHNMSKAEEAALLDFVDARSGIVEKFWCPGHRVAFSLSQTMPVASSVLYVLDNGFSRVYRGYERVYIELTNGDIITRKIISVSAGPGDNEITLQLDVVTDREIVPSDVIIFGRLYLVRFAKGKFDLEYGANWESSVKLEFQELVKEYPA